VFVTNRDALLADTPVTRRYVPVQESQTSIVLRLVSTVRKDPRYVTEPGVEELASVQVDLSGTMHLPVAEREVEVAMHFAQTHVRVEARNVRTGEPQTADIQWRPTW
jgi:hypothetical protein